MSKAGAIGRGLYALIAFLVNTTLRIGLNLSLVASVAMTIYAVGHFSNEALKQRKEGKNCDFLDRMLIFLNKMITCRFYTSWF